MHIDIMISEAVKFLSNCVTCMMQGRTMQNERAN